MCNLHFCYTFCTGVTLELHCSQPIRIGYFFYIYVIHISVNYIYMCELSVVLMFVMKTDIKKNFKKLFFYRMCKVLLRHFPIKDLVTTHCLTALFCDAVKIWLEALAYIRSKGSLKQPCLHSLEKKPCFWTISNLLIQLCHLNCIGGKIQISARLKIYRNRPERNTEKISNIYFINSPCL